MRTVRSALLALACCGALAPGAAAQGARDSISLGMVLEPPHLDPTAGAAAATDEVVYANVFEGLTRIDLYGRVQPGLAEGLVSNRGTLLRLSAEAQQELEAEATELLRYRRINGVKN